MSRGTTDRRAGPCRTDRGDAFPARYVVVSSGPLQPPEAARHPRHREFARPHVPHQPVGLRLHRRRRRRRARPAGRQAGRGHRHRRHRDPGRAAPRPRRPRSSTSCSARRRTVDVRDDRPTDPRGGRRWSRAGSARRRENFLALVTAGEPPRGPGRRPVDRHRAGPRAAAARAAPARTPPLAVELADHQKMDGAARPGRRDRRGSRDGRGRCSPGTGRCASGPASATATCRRSTATTCACSTPRGEGVERITAGGLVVDGVEYPVDLVVFATGFEPGADPAVRAGADVRGRGRDHPGASTGPTACAPCTAG